MPSITSWIRLEPRARSKDMALGLQARVYDPLWLLARQWQVGEFKGQDGGSPVLARLRAEASRLTRYRPGPPSDGTTAAGQGFDSSSLPLETLVERERVHAEDDLSVRLAAEAGLHFLRLLDRGKAQKYRQNYINLYGLDPWLLRLRDLADPGGLAARLRDGRDPLSSYLRQRCSARMRALLDAYQEGMPPPELQRALVAELNSLLIGPCLYDPQRFAQVTLTEETLQLAGRALAGELPRDALSHVNRLLLEEAYPDLIARPDTDSRRFFTIMARRVPDGARLYEDLRSALRPPRGRPAGLPPQPPIPAADRPSVTGTATAWLDWYERLFSEPAPDTPQPWVSERMEYQFAVSAATADGELTLTTEEYAEGHLDWHAVDVHPGLALGATGTPDVITRTVVPAPVRYPGMPAPRWWEFEDARIDFGAVNAGPDDLARLIPIEFALIYGNDWFVMPVELPVGSLCRTRSLVVTDTFGERTLIAPYTEVDEDGSPWRMFALSLDRRAAADSGGPFRDIFFLPPALAASLEGPPLEEVLFLRDEMANLAWALERVVESRHGRPLNRFETFQQEQRWREQLPGPSGPIAPPTAAIRYQLATRVPDYWIPLVPQQIVLPDRRPSIRLVRGELLRTSPDQPSKEPQGRVLEPRRSLRLHEEEVGRAGARVTRAYQYARWTDGSTHLWIGRRKQPGRGEGSSGLRFDVVEARRT